MVATSEEAMKLTDEQVKYVMDGQDMMGPFPDCEIWTGVLDYPEFQCGEEIDVPARNLAEAKVRIKQVADEFYDKELTVLRYVRPLREMPGTYQSWSM